jgi:hypothetical protein
LLERSENPRDSKFKESNREYFQRPNKETIMNIWIMISRPSQLQIERKFTINIKQFLDVIDFFYQPIFIWSEKGTPQSNRSIKMCWMSMSGDLLNWNATKIFINFNSLRAIFIVHQSKHAPFKKLSIKCAN